jgi:hypothetical protein
LLQVQNADDNIYPENVEPTLTFILQESGIIVLNNEQGFSAKNIRALCDVGNSTKKGSNVGYIGRKGIGFKSVFRVMFEHCYHHSLLLFFSFFCISNKQSIEVMKEGVTQAVRLQDIILLSSSFFLVFFSSNLVYFRSFPQTRNSLYFFKKAGAVDVKGLLI